MYVCPVHLEGLPCFLGVFYHLWLLGMVVDVENLFMSVHKEEDTDTKQVYFYLFKVSFSRSRDGEALVRIGDPAL